MNNPNESPRSGALAMKLAPLVMLVIANAVGCGSGIADQKKETDERPISKESLADCLKGIDKENDELDKTIRKIALHVGLIIGGWVEYEFVDDVQIWHCADQGSRDYDDLVCAAIATANCIDAEREKGPKGKGHNWKFGGRQYYNRETRGVSEESRRLEICERTKTDLALKDNTIRLILHGLKEAVNRRDSGGLSRINCVKRKY